MKITHRFNHDINLVFKTLTDPEFLQQRALSLGSKKVSCEHSGALENCQIKLVREREINIPAVLSAFLKKTQIATTMEHWQQQGETYLCENQTEIDGAPLSISGTMALTPDSGTCIYSVEFNTRAKIMFGKKNLQSYAGKTIAKEIELECVFTDEYLASLK